MDAFANNLSVLRRSKNLTQDELAEALGVDRQTISAWEKATQSPSLGAAVSVAKFFGVSLDALASKRLTLVAAEA